MIWSSIASFGLNLFKKINAKTLMILSIVALIGYFGYKYSDVLEDLALEKESNAALEYSLSQKLETIKSKDKLITDLQEDLKNIQRLQKEQQEENNKINKENEQNKIKISEIKDKCLDSDMPVELIRMFSTNKD